MKKILLIAIVLFMNSILFAQTAMEDKNKISVIGVGNKTAFPNAAQITIVFEHVKPTLREAINENQKTTEDVLKIVKKFVSDFSEIKTSLIATNKATVWNAKQNKEIFIGFESSQKLIFTLKELDKMQDFTEQLLKTKFNKIASIAYFNTEAEEYIKKAQELAILDAMETTKRMAKIANINTGAILYMQSNNSPNENANNRVHTYEFESYGKGMGGRGVSSSGELIKYSTVVTLHTEIVN